MMPRSRKISDAGSIVSKSGDQNVISVSVPDKLYSYLRDFCTTLIDIQWRWNLLMFAGTFVTSWLVFAAFYFMLADLNGDLESHTHEERKPCVTNIHSFASSFLFSIETMTTIGYGSRFVTEACPGAYIGVLVQSIIGAALQLALAGLVVAKIRRAKKRTGTILFSNVACIYEEEDGMKLVIRVGDMRKSRITAAHVRGYLIQKFKSKRGTIPVSYYTLRFRSENGTEQLFLPWPSLIIHDINEDSPLWEVSKDDLELEDFEMIFMLEGIASSTSMAFQAKKAYAPCDFKWGRRFHALGTTTDYVGENYVDYEYFHLTYPLFMSELSAMDRAELRNVSPSIPSLPSSTETVRKRRFSRTESICSSIFKRRHSISDTYLGLEFDDLDNFEESKSHGD